MSVLQWEKNLLRLLLVRHGETAWNATGWFQGQMDIGLNVATERQAVAVAERLASEEIHAIYASDLRRAYDTAVMIAARHPVAVQADPRLREINFGAWQGLTYAHMQEQDPEGLAAWNADRANRCPPGGESLSDVASRLTSLLDEVRLRNVDQTVVLVSHGGTVRLVLCLLLGHPLSAYWQFEVDNTAIAEVELQDRGPVLIRWNDVHHLTDGHRQSVF